MPPQAVDTLADDLLRQAERARARYLQRPVEGPADGRQKHRRSEHQFSFLFPLSLLRSVHERRSVDLVLAYGIDERKKLSGLSGLKGTAEYTNAGCIMDALKIRFDRDTYADLVDQARQQVLDYQTRHGKQPMVKIHQGVLLDAYRGDLPLNHFVVYAAIMSCLGRKQMPQRITVAQIQRLAHGFHSRRSFNFGIESDAFTVHLTYHQVRRITLTLSHRHHFFQRATVGLWTWYATDGILKTLGVKSLHQYALNVARRNKRLELKDQREQLEINEAWKRAKLDLADEQRQLREQRDAQKRKKVAEEVKQARLTADDLQQEFGFRPYRHSDVSDTHWQAMRHELVVDGETFGVLQSLTQEVQAQLTQRGVTVLR